MDIKRLIKSALLTTPFIAATTFGLYSPGAAAVPSLQIGDADGGVCDSYDISTADCLVGGTFSVTSLLASAGYVVFAAVPKTGADTFTIDPMIGGVSLDLVQSGFGAPPFEDNNNLAPHGIFDTYVEVYRLDFDGPLTTVFNTQPGGSPGSADGYIEFIDMNLTALTDGLHIDLFRCDTGSVEGGDCNVSGGDFAPFSHDATYVPVPAAVWLFGTGLLGLVGVARRKRA